jgi:hypothetical protein
MGCSLESQGRWLSADSYVHAGKYVFATAFTGDLPALPIFWQKRKVKFGSVVLILSSICLPVITMRRGEPRAMKLLPQVLLVDDNPADVGRTQEALAGGQTSKPHQQSSKRRRHPTARGNIK